MADTFSRLIEALRVYDPALKGEAHEDWGMTRASIRAALARGLSGLSESDRRACANLSEPPRLTDWSVSIAHAQDLGGWMAVPRPAQIGWDVEARSRIKQNVIDRVCTPEEVEQAPEPSFLWVAKESLFKALEDFQPTAITQLTILGWKGDKAKNVWTWAGVGPHNSHGVLIAAGDLLVAGCLIM